ncbi:c-Myc-binding protein [Sesamum alatum]|uniref:c-Myc-binding protein n=1 Tax=Sesamum alatum TaxID=300844 RepID=A0AAE1YJD8_9LAMI|nr:c-Myc-binding protein [Sesamum alatum]
MEKEAKKEAFRKYLESSGVLDALTKVLVALYEQNDKPSSAIEFIQQKLGGPTLAEYEKLQAEVSDLQIRYNELLAVHQDKCREHEELKNTHMHASSKETAKEEGPSEGL